MSYVETFDELIKGLVNTERQNEYGHPRYHFHRSACIKAQLQSCDDVTLRHVLEMIADKMARLVHNPEHFDSWLDIAGYARTALMVMDAREETEKEMQNAMSRKDVE